MIDDVTEKTRLAQEEAEQTELLAMFKGLTGDREGFLTFFEETTRMVGELAQGVLDDEARVRHLHTLKGTAAMHGAQLIAEICHRAEDALEVNPEGIAPLIARLEQRWGEIQGMLGTFLDEESQGRVEVSQRALDQLSDDVRAGLPSEEIARRLAALALEPVERPLARLARHASKLAARLGKGDLSVAVEATGVRGDRKRLRPLWSALVHLIRNAIDHGIEPADRASGTRQERRRADCPARHRKANVAGRWRSRTTVAASTGHAFESSPARAACATIPVLISSGSCSSTGSAPGRV